MWLFFVTQYNLSLSSFVLNFRILSQVVAEKSLTEKKFTDRQTNKQTNRQTNIITEKAKLYTPIYFVPGYKYIINYPILIVFTHLFPKGHKHLSKSALFNVCKTKQQERRRPDCVFI